jgi:hypothetical protein
VKGEMSVGCVAAGCISAVNGHQRKRCQYYAKITNNAFGKYITNDDILFLLEC